MKTVSFENVGIFCIACFVYFFFFVPFPSLDIEIEMIEKIAVDRNIHSILLTYSYVLYISIDLIKYIH